MQTIVVDITGQGQLGIRMLGTVYGKLIVQVQGPGFVRISSDPDDLTNFIQGTPAGFLLDQTMGIKDIPWSGPVWVVAGGAIVSTSQQTAVVLQYEFAQDLNQQPAPASPTTEQNPSAWNEIVDGLELGLGGAVGAALFGNVFESLRFGLGGKR